MNLKQIDVDQLYVDVYVLDTPCSVVYANIDDLLRNSDLRQNFNRFGLGERNERSPGLKAAKLYKKLMILGKPGSGKSTFLRHIAIDCCKGKFLAGYIPILIELREIDASKFNLLNEIHQEFAHLPTPEFELDNEEQTKQLLKKGQILILLDGLDEVASQFRQTVQKDINGFCKDHHEMIKNGFIRLIITCRTQTTEYRLPNFEYIEVADFNSEQVERFANNWFSTPNESAEDASKLKTKFLEKLRSPENKPIAELAVTPILLSLTCWVFSDLKKFPSKRSDLYKNGTDLLLEQWDETRGIRRDSEIQIYREMSPTDRQKLLSDIAFRKFEQEQYALFEASEIQKYIAEYLKIKPEKAKKLPKTIEAQHGLLVERAKDIYSFSHLTFQEFLTAQHISDQPRLVKELVETHITDPRWREVFLLLAELKQDDVAFPQLMEQQTQTYVASSKLQDLLAWAERVTNDSETEEIKLVRKRAIVFDFALTHAAIFTQKTDSKAFQAYENLYSYAINVSCAYAADSALSTKTSSSRSAVSPTIKTAFQEVLADTYFQEVLPDFPRGFSPTNTGDTAFQEVLAARFANKVISMPATRRMIDASTQRVDIIIKELFHELLFELFNELFTERFPYSELSHRFEDLYHRFRDLPLRNRFRDLRKNKIPNELLFELFNELFTERFPKDRFPSDRFLSAFLDKRLPSDVDDELVRNVVVRNAVVQAKAASIIVAQATAYAKRLHGYVEEIEKFKVYKNIDFNDLLNKLNNLQQQIPDNNQPLEVYQNFVDDIFLTVLEGFQLTREMINLSVEEFENIKNYFDANMLMLDCKEAASQVSSETWDKIEARMLLPQSSWEKLKQQS